MQIINLAQLTTFQTELRILYFKHPSLVRTQITKYRVFYFCFRSMHRFQNQWEIVGPTLLQCFDIPDK